MTVCVAFVWHMHQPVYLEPGGDGFAMPWVRLHGLKAYADMAWMVERVAGTEVTFNLVPSLIYQLDAYLQGKRDHFWRLADRPAEDLDDRETEALLTHFFSCNCPTMVEPYASYRALPYLRGKMFNPSASVDVFKRFTTPTI